MSASRTSSTKGQMFGPRRGHVADSTVSDLIYEKICGNTSALRTCFPTKSAKIKLKFDLFKRSN